jgi:hypothetical protein
MSMEAQLVWAAPRALRIVATFVAISISTVAAAAGYRTTNFTVAARTPELAKEIGDMAEKYRVSLANQWLGHELPNWSQPCPISAKVSPQLGAGGATSFVFDRGEVFGWKMDIQGSHERVLDSVLPHEITHTVFATHFRQPLPRWADEGACTTVEHQSEIAKQERMLIDFLKTKRGIPFNQMFAMKEYPQDVLPLYAQGHSLARYLIAQRGKHEFLSFLADGMRDENWPKALQEHYEYEHLLALQNSWLDWVKAGRPEIQPTGGVMLASAQAPQPSAPAVARGDVAVMSPGATGQGQNGVQSAQASIRPPAPATATPAQGASTATTPVAKRSVYGESVTWAPAKRRAAGMLHEASRPQDVASR